MKQIMHKTWVAWVSGGVVLLLILYALLRDTNRLITLQEARSLIVNERIERVWSDDGYVYILTKEDEHLKILASQLPSGWLAHYRVEQHGGEWIWILVLFVVMGGVGYWAWRDRLGFESEQEVIASLDPQVLHAAITPVKSTVRFKDIGGISEVKEELEEIIDFLRHPKRYHTFGARMPRGVLLVGPPGVGKTMIAKAVAAEAEVPFFYQSGASFVQIYVGMGAKRVSELFAVAKKNAPAIIFIDEIDAVGKKREGGHNDEREATLNQLLTEMDGFEESSGIIVIAATNNIEVMDSALLRAGRFDRRIFVELPTLLEREAILQTYLRRIPHELSVTEVAKMTVGFSGAALAALANEAALLCLRHHELQVHLEHFLAVKDKVMFGKKKMHVLSPQQRRYHTRYQAAKVLVATWFDLPFEKMTLRIEVLRPSEELMQRELESYVRVALSGIVASRLSWSEHGTYAKGDLALVHELSTQMVREYGMGETLFDDAIEPLITRLELEVQRLLERHEKLLQTFEAILDEVEFISKALAKSKLDEVF